MPTKGGELFGGATLVLTCLECKDWLKVEMWAKRKLCQHYDMMDGGAPKMIATKSKNKRCYCFALSVWVCSVFLLAAC